jgi:hypothetical protein
MSYEDLCKNLGIDREAITKAATEPSNGAITQEKGLWRVPMGKRILAPDRKDEDVSHLVSPLARRIANKLKAKPRRAKK